MHVFAIDLGNKRVKMKSERGEYSYPASYLTTKFLSSDSLSAHEKVEVNQIYKLDDGSDMSFIWGPSLEIYNVPENMIDTYARSKRMKQKKAQRLLEFALGRLALDFKEECSEESPLNVHVILGAPITDMHASSDALETLTELLVGRHHLQINGKNLWINILSKEHISIIPQYMGTILNSAFDQDLNPVPTYVEGQLGVVDIGGGTVLVNSSNALNLSPTGIDKFSGIQTLVKDISSAMNSTKGFLIESLLRKGDVSQGYFYKTNHNEKDVKDVTDIVASAIDAYTRFTIAPLITESFPDLEDFDFIIMTGGGAALLSKTALLDELGEDYFERLVFVSEPELSNVRGFYKGALLKWGSDEDGNGDETDSIEERFISEKWGTAPVKFEKDTGLLTVYSGKINAQEWPSSIKRSDIKEINISEKVSLTGKGSFLFGGNVFRGFDNAMTSLIRIVGMGNISSTEVTDMSFMFNGCHALETIDLAHLDTSKVTDFNNMFANCSSITHLNLKSFDTAAVKNYDSMFYNCKKLRALDISTFQMKSDITKVDMLEGCISLVDPKLPTE